MTANDVSSMMHFEIISCWKGVNGCLGGAYQRLHSLYGSLIAGFTLSTYDETEWWVTVSNSSSWGGGDSTRRFNVTDG